MKEPESGTNTNRSKGPKGSMRKLHLNVKVGLSGAPSHRMTPNLHAKTNINKEDPAASTSENTGAVVSVSNSFIQGAGEENVDEATINSEAHLTINKVPETILVRLFYPYPNIKSLKGKLSIAEIADISQSYLNPS